MAGSALNATAASLLGFLHDGPSSGWDLVAQAQRSVGDFWSLTRSQVYRELAALDAAGLVASGAAGVRDKRPYAITDAGRAAFAEWASQDPGDESIRFPLLLLVALGRHVPPQTLRTTLRSHRERHEQRLAGYLRLQDELLAGAAPPDAYALATLDFGTTYERAVLEWFDRLPPSVRGRREA